MKRSLFVIILNLSCAFVIGQTSTKIKNLVFEGAGIRGIAYGGAIEELEKAGMMKDIEKVGGTSAGAITAMTISLGYNSEEIGKIISTTNFKKFNDGEFFFIGGIRRTSKFFGWYRGNKVESWLEKLIEKKTGNADISFKELHEKGFKELYITGTCMNKQQLVVFSRHNYPSMKVKDAVRISMSIPLYFESVFIDKEGKVVHHPKSKEGLDVMVDGGITGNFPISIFDSSGWKNPETLGFRIDSDAQVDGDTGTRKLVVLPVTTFKEYMRAFYNISIENLNRQSLTEADWQRTVSIQDGTIGSRIRKLSGEEINMLIENGRKGMRKYLNRKHL